VLAQRGEQILALELATRLLERDPLADELAHQSTEMAVQGLIAHAGSRGSFRRKAGV
jgi:hypothetical protein